MAFECSALRELLARFGDLPDLAPIRDRLALGSGLETAALLDCYERALPPLERAIWQVGPDVDAIALYQATFRERERLLAERGGDERHRFVVIIPIADRPLHLQNILGSLLALCRAFEYGGMEAGRFRKVLAVIADDSADTASIAHNRAIAKSFTAEGLETRYFGTREQARRVECFSREEREALASIIGFPEQTGFRHKGASVTRNLGYLLAADRVREPGRSLFFFVDSDEQFKVRVAGPTGEADLAALNYFHHLDRIFAAGNVQVVTGKVVGDPPVSPAVMTGNFLEDVFGFLTQIGEWQADSACAFHEGERRGSSDAAYHDMADLFGFAVPEEAFRYHCPVAGAHDHAACLAAFGRRLDDFFDGEHPTRVSYFQFGDDFPSLAPARTVYTGNYVVNAAGLSHFIPFAPLKLRMAGPVLGRLLRAEIGAGFVTANLPLLHTRTTGSDAGAEFRPGVDRDRMRVDLCGEFERQFFGDVMLFSVETLAEAGFPARQPTTTELQTVVEEVYASMLEKYRIKQKAILQRLDRVRTLFDEPHQWWNRADRLDTVRADFHRFFANVERNFGDGSRCYALIRPGEHQAERLASIQRALLGYAADRQAWAATRARSGGSPA